MTLLQTIQPVTHDLGAFQVRRVLPSPRRVMVGPFIFVDQFGPAVLPPGVAMDVRPHPHIGLATVTRLFEGAINHRDSLGTFATIRPGQVNLMTAGRGIVHSERGLPEEHDRAKPIYGMQTWLAMPDGKEEIAPGFEAHADLPLIEGAGVQARVIMGTLWGQTAPTLQHSPTVYADIVLEAGGALPVDAEADERAVMLVGGEASIDGIELELYSLAVLRPGAAMKLGSTLGGRVMLLGGAAITGQRHVWWNFVHSRREAIREAIDLWNRGGFPIVPGDEDEFIPIPPVPLTRTD